MADANATVPSRRARTIVLGTLVVAIGLGAILYYRPWRSDAIDPPAPGLSHVDPAVRKVIEDEQSRVRESPRSGRAWGRLGMAFQSHMFDAEALSCFEQAAGLEPDNPRWPYFRGVIRMAHDPPAALADLQRAVELCRDATDGPRLRLAELYLRLGQPDDAREQFQALVSKDPAHARARFGLARLDFQSGQLDQSREHLRHALESPLARKSALTLSAEISQRQGDAAAARAERARGVELPDDPDWPDEYLAEAVRFQVGEVARLQQAGQLLDRGSATEAIDLLQDVVRDYPRSAAGWTLLGRAQLGEDHIPEAEESLWTAVKLDPARARAWMYLGVVRARRGDRPGAIAALRTAVANRPSYTEAQFNLGIALKDAGETDAAIGAFRDAVRSEPLSALAHAQLGELLLKQGRPDEAIIHLQQAVDLNPDDQDSRKRLDEARQKSADAKKSLDSTRR
ncbi:MAG TPA: tetratricopeptide repeat protein [Gemmataceae bacterium]|nr:tetratricopeptide repeat protein [Gemmataceae bacterium]